MLSKLNEPHASIIRMTEALPVAITSLFPLVLFPFFQVLNADETAEEYFNDTTYVFIGSTLVAYAMEKVRMLISSICNTALIIIIH